jgi:hypothetical protein
MSQRSPSVAHPAQPAASVPAVTSDYRMEDLAGRSPSEVAVAVAELEAAAIKELAARFGPAFDRAVDLLAGLRGQLIVSGVGKSGLMAHRRYSHRHQHSGNLSPSVRCVARRSRHPPAGGCRSPDLEER